MLQYRQGDISRKSILLLQYYDLLRIKPVVPCPAESAEPLPMLCCPKLVSHRTHTAMRSHHMRGDRVSALIQNQQAVDVSLHISSIVQKLPAGPACCVFCSAYWSYPSKMLCCAVLCCAVLCCAVLCCAVLCCAVLCCAILSGFRVCHAKRIEDHQSLFHLNRLK